MPIYGVLSAQHGKEIFQLDGRCGIGFFRGILPDAAVDYVVSLHVNRLSVFTWASLVSAILQLALLGCIYRLTRSSRTCAATMS